MFELFVLCEPPKRLVVAAFEPKILDAEVLVEEFVGVAPNKFVAGVTPLMLPEIEFPVAKGLTTAVEVEEAKF